jgi:Ni,Fe-hydrogenase III small subunit
VSAGGCNGCELEVNALTNVNFDIGRYGIDIVASPRHADGLVLTGPITRNMARRCSCAGTRCPSPSW